MTSWDKYSGKAAGWSEREYADPPAYLASRAKLVRTLGPPLRAGDVVLDLACGDGAFADFLPAQRYIGVDANEEMVAAGRARGRELRCADMNDYVPLEKVQVTTIFRAIYYARDRRALLERIAGYTECKLVFDLNPRQYPLADVLKDLEAAGFDRIAKRPFLVPQTRKVPLLAVIQRTGPLAQLLLRFRFTLFIAASRREEAS
jgi:SAM-dependent methyltransferase